MYIPRHFSVTDEIAQEFLRKTSSGHLVTNTEAGLLATFIPVHFRPSTNSLIGHLARGNEQWSKPSIKESLFIATSIDSYISPTWYASKKEHGKVVPTWDYMMAHIYGELSIHDDVEWLRSAVSELTDSFEGSRPKPWKLADAPEDYVAGQLRAIVGVELKVNRLEVSFKMSQNKTKEDLDGVIAGLRSDGKTSVADLVESLRPEDKK
jgi:transcriptional regulator